jgi:hypothetical protein
MSKLESASNYSIRVDSHLSPAFVSRSLQIAISVDRGAIDVAYYLSVVPLNIYHRCDQRDHSYYLRPLFEPVLLIPTLSSILPTRYMAVRV